MKTLTGEAASTGFNSKLESIQLEWFKLLTLQDGSASEDCPSLRAWCRGEYAAAHASIYELEPRAFCTTTRRLRCQGAELVRFFILDDTNGEPPPYASWIIHCAFPRTNVALGHEDVFVLPRTRCAAAGLQVPNYDQNLCDGLSLITTHYTNKGISHRIFYKNGITEDEPAIQAAQALRINLAWLVEAGDKIQPIAEGLPRHLHSYLEGGPAEHLAVG